MPPGGFLDSGSTSLPAEGWDDAALLRQAREKALALLESLTAQQRDLQARRALDDTYDGVRHAMDRAIEAVRQTIASTTHALSDPPEIPAGR